MALAQAELVADLLRQAEPDLDVSLAQNDPRGDRDQISRLDRHGGKGGAFVAEIRADVLAGRSQCAMHSLKDMPGNEETPGLVIGAYLKRENPTDSGFDSSVSSNQKRCIIILSSRRATFTRSSS